MIIYKAASSTKELNGILALQKANLPTAVSMEEQEAEGFVTVHHSMDILHRMNQVCPHIIAKYKSVVIGYALCMHSEFGNEIEVLKPMFAKINSLIPRGTSYVVMGQICIDKKYRRQGIFRKLYETMKASVSPAFDCIITEVDTRNTRSLNAHYAVGFRLLECYHADGRDWELIRLKV